MESLSSFQRQYLKGIAHHLKPVVQIGKNGLTDQLLTAVDIALNTHELIKIKFLDFQDRKKELFQEITEKCHGEPVGLVGNVAILYRQQADLAKRKITLPA